MSGSGVVYFIAVSIQLIVLFIISTAHYSFGLLGSVQWDKHNNSLENRRNPLFKKRVVGMIGLFLK